MSMSVNRIIFFTGKGGTGKSVISAATSLLLSELGYDTLIISSDPAHSLSDAFQVSVDRDITRIRDNLYALNVDPVKEAAQHYGVLMDYIASIFRSRGIDEIIAYELAAMPGMTGIATILKLDEIIEKHSFDCIVVDMVPSGEALRFLYIPALMGKISRRVLKLVSPIASMSKILEPVVGVPAPDRESIDKGLEIVDRIERIKNYILNHDVTSVRLVTNPDSFSINNTRRTYIQAVLYGLNPDLIVVNKVFPKVLKDTYLSEWVDAQAKLIVELEDTFYPLPIRRLKLFDRELKGIELLLEAAKEVYGDDDPASVFYKDVGIEVHHKDGELEIIFPVRYVGKEDLDIERIGDELLVTLYTDMGPTTLVIPLPAITYKMRLIRAKLINDRLHLIFMEERGNDEQ